MGGTGRSVKSRPLSAEDWTARALELLMDEGVGAVKISRLCSDLGVTKGSFYWRFEDLESLKEAIAEKWCSDSRRALGNLAGLAALAPLERLRAMTLGLIDDRAWSVQRALRDWARTDEQVAATIAQSDTFMLEAVQQAIEELGSTPERARLRAGLLVYAGIGFAHGQSGLPKPEVSDIDDLIDFLAEDAEVGARSGQPPAT
jgi:AcrR family transcriptional regulator